MYVHICIRGEPLNSNLLLTPVNTKFYLNFKVLNFDLLGHNSTEKNYIVKFDFLLMHFAIYNISISHLHFRDDIFSFSELFLNT